MKVFLTGSTGVLGRPVLKKMVRRGHEVFAYARSEGNRNFIEANGATPVFFELDHPESIGFVLEEMDAVLHLASAIPPLKHAANKTLWEENNWLRETVTPLLVDAAIEQNVAKFVYPSINLFYPDKGDEWQSSSPITGPATMMRSTIVAEAAVARFSDHNRQGVVLRMGQVYGEKAGSTREVLKLAGIRLFPYSGKQDGYVSFVHHEDAARAIVSAAESDVDGTFDIVDDQPISRLEIKEMLAEIVGAKHLMSLPEWLIGIQFGQDAEVFTRSLRISNQAFKKATGWVTQYPDPRIGWRRAAAAFATARFGEKGQFNTNEPNN